MNSSELFTTSSTLLETSSEFIDGSSVLDLGSSLAGPIVNLGVFITGFMEPFVDIADGVSTLLGLIA